MEARLQRRVQRYGWDRAATSYEPLWRTQLATAQHELMRHAALVPGERVLDVACGTGRRGTRRGQGGWTLSWVDWPSSSGSISPAG
jgi:2-polyprenyl-3-methyl-5-hydroxy-6-metoxy-1,4-benzoquinol methylase